MKKNFKYNFILIKIKKFEKLDSDRVKKQRQVR